jgi:hypothetical protein
MVQKGLSSSCDTFPKKGFDPTVRCPLDHRSRRMLPPIGLAGCPYRPGCKCLYARLVVVLYVLYAPPGGGIASYLAG